MSAAAETTVGIVANAASGRDIRRLTTGASVFDNAEKGSMVARLMAGLGATGVGRVLMMPAGGGLAGTLIRRLDSRRDNLTYPVLELLPWRSWQKSLIAVALFIIVIAGVAMALNLA